MTTRPARPSRDRNVSFARLLVGLSLPLIASSVIACSASSTNSDFGDGGSAGTSGSAGTISGAGGSSTGLGGSSGSAGSAGSVVAGSSGSAGSAGSNACDSVKYDSQLQPGAVLIVFDASQSMDDAPDGSSSTSGPTKWEIATGAIRQMVDSLPDAALVGVMLFPDEGSNDCAVDPVPNVEVAPLGQNRDAIKAVLDPATSPYGGATPLGHAIEKGHTYLHNRSDLAGTKAILLVTDGVPSTLCDETEQDTPQNAKLGLQNWNQKTFVVGLAGSNEQLLSLAAYNGGTPRVPDCIPQCCPNTGGIFDTGCTEQEILTCCNYTAEGAGTQTDLVAALSEFSSAFLTSCIFTVPKGDNPSEFDPGLVNVLVTINGGTPTTIPQNATSGWTYADSNNDTLELHGDICTQILNNPSSVDIELGCPTQIQ
ncbi:MAG: vWA domain-containing protein [Polyangiaceae bacterium]